MHKLEEQIVRVDQIQDPTICCLQETHFKYKDIYSSKIKRWQKIYHANTNQKNAKSSNLISDRANLKAKK